MNIRYDDLFKVVKFHESGIPLCILQNFTLHESKRYYFIFMIQINVSFENYMFNNIFIKINLI